MLRQTLIICLLACFTAIQAQNYECLRTDHSYFYSYEESYPNSLDPEIRAYRIDSTVASGNNLILFTQKESINTLPGDLFGCYDPNGPSWIGNVKKTQSGKYYFTNNIYCYDMLFGQYLDIHDTMVIRSQAGLGESWCFYKSDTLGPLFYAHVSAIDTMSFLGITDSVKYIQIDLIDDFSITLILSKHYGFIRCLDFRNFNPGIYYFNQQLSYSTFMLSGISGSGLGNDLITVGQIYDFNLSDEFHSNTYIHDVYGNLLAIENRVKVILDKYFSTDGDTVIYTIDDTYWYYTSSGTYLYHDTIISQYSDLEQAFPEPDKLPFENIYYFDGSIGYYGMYSGFGGRQYVYDCSQIYYADPEDTCFHDSILLKNLLSPPLNQTQFIQGCGSYTWMVDPEFWSCTHCESLQYYKKGTQEWGNPLIIPVGTDELKSPGNQLQIYPSPASEYIKIKMPPGYSNSPTRIDIFNSVGNGVMHISVMNTQIETTINITGLPVGLYIAVMTDDAEKIASGKFLVVRY